MNKQIQNEGVILLVTLFFMLIFTLWSLTLIRHVGEMAELNQHAFKQQFGYDSHRKIDRGNSI